MKLQIRNDSVIIEGYVNAIERKSKPLMSRIGQFVERICKGAFAKALKRNDDVKILLNHDWNKMLGSTKEGNLELYEDSIGLHARAEIFDADVVKKAKNGDLIGWSFGFSDRDVENSFEKGMAMRDVKDLDLYEVSILDRNKTAAYDGTLVETRTFDENEITLYRAEEIDAEWQIVDESESEEIEESETTEEVVEGSFLVEEKEIREEIQEIQEPKQQEIVEKIETEIDYSVFENAIKSMKGV